MSGVKTSDWLPPAPVPDDDLEVVTARGQQPAVGGEVNAVHTPVVPLQLPLQAQALSEGLERVHALRDGVAQPRRVRALLPGIQVTQAVAIQTVVTHSSRGLFAGKKKKKKTLT